MKSNLRIGIICTLAYLLISTLCFAQSPEKMSYQAVIRNESGELVTTQVGMKLSILKGADASSAAKLYSETLTPTPNANGLVSVEFGGQTGWDVIDWSSGKFFIKTETDPGGGTNYTITGVSQLLSVPYALHAKTAGSVSGGITETDPAYSTSEAASITSADITNLGNLSGINTGDQDISGITTNTQAIKDTASQIRADMPDVSGFISTETDPEFTAWDKDYNDLIYKPTTITAAQASAVTANTGKDTTGIYHSNRTALDKVSGTNTGDQDISGIATNTQAIKDTASLIRTALADSITALRDYVGNHYVGELYGGGIVFYVDQTGEHGLIASLNDLDGGSGVAWSNVTNTEIGTAAQSMTNGSSNTDEVIAQIGHTASAAKLCVDYAGGGFNDWYLPADRELYLLASQDILIDNILNNDGDAATNGFLQEYMAPINGRYWSSTEKSSADVWSYNFSYGYSYFVAKSGIYKVRCIRAF